MSIELETRIDLLMQQNAALALENERLQAVINEANGQEPVGIVEIWNQGGSGQFSTLSGIHKIAHGTRLYTKPIPAHHISDSGKMIDQSEDKLEMVYPKGTNRYGLDAGYLGEKLFQFLRDIDSHTPSEAARVLVRLSVVADENVLRESEFAGFTAQGFNRDSDEALDKTISVYSSNPVLNEVK